uniref:Putative secreted protein n=1 Tax=Anopheles darlingi TaxID=43151 RepID=A0A2M4DFF4_ANODA
MAARSASVNFTVPFVVVVVVVVACCLPSVAGVPDSPSPLELVPTSAIVCRQSRTRVPSVLPFVVVDTVGGWRGCAATAGFTLVFSEGKNAGDHHLATDSVCRDCLDRIPSVSVANSVDG